MPAGIYDSSKRRKSAHPLKTRVICKKCFRVFYPDTSIMRATQECPHCGVKIDIRDKRGAFEEYSKKYPEKAAKRKESMIQWETEHKLERAKKTRETVRKVIFNLLSDGNPVCANCGCDDARFLEINHINGGGTKELHKGQKTNSFYLDIYSGRRKTDDLNLLCKICNALHFLELKNGKLPFVVSWIKDESNKAL